MTIPLKVMTSQDNGAARPANAALPLCVDLDGTLILGDSLHDALAVGLHDVPGLAKAAFELRKGKAAFKRAVYEIAELDPVHLPYNQEFLTWLREERAKGRELHLVTAADARIANAVAAHLGLFDDVICSDGVRNIRGSTKAATLVERFGQGGFCYAGNDHTDHAVWEVAGGAVIVNASSSVAEKARRGGNVEAEFAGVRASVKSLIKAVRPHQWAKNVLIFLPIIASTEFLDYQGWLNAIFLFAAFCFAASSIYVVNDLSDLNADRRHPRKRLRPFASGAVPVKAAVLLSGGLLAAALAIAAPIGAIPLVLIYAAVSGTYSLALKEKALVDVFVLAALYSIRIVAGGIVSGHLVTEWLIGFSVFLFLSLALAKRVAELLGTRARAGGQLSRRAYTDADVPILQTMGVASAFVAALVLALYLQSQAAHNLYQEPVYLLAVAVATLLWLSRVWLMTARGEMDDDPVVWAVKDRASQLLGIVVAIAMLVAIGRFW